MHLAHQTPLRNIKLLLAYDGTGFHGWQRQALQPTIQKVLEAAIALLTQERVSIIGSGRTDAGVHALGQVANFRTHSGIPVEGLLRGLNSILPHEIAVLSATVVPADFHARYHALGKTYGYRLLVSPVRSPLFRHRAWVLNHPLDLDAMREAVGSLVGRHDFRAFQASGGSVKTSVRTVFSCGIEALHLDRPSPPDAKHYIFSIAADGFLRYMVRNIAGTLVQIGLDKRSPADMAQILKAADRSAAGPTAPPHGLYLERVHYDSPPESDTP